MASLFNLQLHPISPPYRVSSNVVELGTQLGFGCSYQNLSRKNVFKGFVLRASEDDDIRVKVENIGVKEESNQLLDINNEPERLRESVPSLLPVVLKPESKQVVDFSNAVSTLQESIGSFRPVILKPENKQVMIFINAVSRLPESIRSLPPVIFVAKRLPGNRIAIGLCVAAMLLVIAARVRAIRKSRDKPPGSVADLVRRGQLRSDRRGISEPLKFEDPFNNPLVKVGKGNLTVEMCGKVYRLAPVTLTREQQTTHQKRRSHAYQWKRPTTFLKEGEAVPSDVDPDTVRWIPANHPFASTVSDIDEGLAQSNVYQKHGVPFRIQAEHDALQKKLEALQSDQRFNNLVIDPGTARNFERPFKSNLKADDQQAEWDFSNGQVSPPKPHQFGNGVKSVDSSSTSEEKQTP